MSGKHSAVSVPAEIYALLLSVYQLHDILLWGPLSGVYLPLVQEVRASKGLRNDAQAFVPSSRRSATAPGNSAGLGPKAPLGRPASMGPDKKSSERFASRACAGNKPPMSIVKAKTRISRRHKKAIGSTCPALSDMSYGQIRKLDKKLRKMQKAYVLASEKEAPVAADKAAAVAEAEAAAVAATRQQQLQKQKAEAVAAEETAAAAAVAAEEATAVATEKAATVANLAAEKIQAMLRRRETPLSPTTELFELPAKDADAHAANGASSTPDVNTIDKDPSEDVDPIDKDPSESKHGDGKPKRRRRKKPQPGLFWNLGKAPRAAKHAPDAESHSPDDSHARDEAKLTPNGKTIAFARSPDLIPPAPENSLYTSAVSSPRDESEEITAVATEKAAVAVAKKAAAVEGHTDDSFTWFCPGCNRLNDTRENGNMCPICHWSVGPDPSVRSQTRSSSEGCEDARANVRKPDPILRTHTRFTRKGYEDAMAPAGSHAHKRWLDHDPCSDCDSDELYSFYDYDSEGGFVGYGSGEE